MNKPIELWTTLKFLSPEHFPNWRGYTNRYCGCLRGGYGEVSEASNIEELSDVLRQSLMTRRLKRDVLKELPSKRRQVLDVASNAAINKALASESAVLAELAGLSKGARIPFENIATARRCTNEAKAPQVIEHVRQALEGGSEKIVVFCHHHSVMDMFQDAFQGHCVRFDGKTSAHLKDQAVDMFQTKSHIRVFIGNIKAAGLGITLTAASHVVFAELPWTPAELVQAEDRCHRIGQHDNVLVQILVAPGSIDSRMAQLICRKAVIVSGSLDGKDESWGEEIGPVHRGGSSRGNRQAAFRGR